MAEPTTPQAPQQTATPDDPTRLTASELAACTSPGCLDREVPHGVYSARTCFR